MPEASPRPQPAWAVLPWGSSEERDAAIRSADRILQVLDDCAAAREPRLDCEEPPCLVFAEFPDADCTPIASLADLAPDCPLPEGFGTDGPIIISGPLVCPDGFTICASALLVSGSDDLSAVESYAPDDSEWNLSAPFHAGRRLLQQGGRWPCASTDERSAPSRSGTPR